MRPLLLFALLGIITYSADMNISSPISSDALSGKSVYASPPGSINIDDDGCVQKEDQNITGHGGAKKW